MKIVRFAAEGKTRYGILNGSAIQVVEEKPFRRIVTTDKYYGLKKVQLLAPCTPTKIIALGLNYHDHARELKVPVPDSPLTFLKPSTAVIGHGDNIIYPSASHRVDYEGELAVVIKKPVWRVATRDALKYVLGYTCFNDVTARDLQK
jgi:2-keto-4-pentenoate hydratase/2-oxohepta-3-ene-1,7-dioic acid hydratase in catechol pathway